MKTISKFLIFTLVLFLVCLGAVSATENVTDTTDSMTDIVTNDISANDILEYTDYNTITNDKVIEKKTESINDTSKEATKTITITNNTYDLYFKEIEKSEFVESTSYIQSGDIINLKGTFKNLKFAVDKNITFTSIDNDAYLEDCTVYVLGQNASGSTISNLNIFNNGTLKKGIQVKGASNLFVENNHIKTLGLRAYGFVADNMNHSTIRNNFFEREGDDWRYISLVMGLCFYNNIENNTLHTGGANGIYFSIYGSQDAKFEGGQCDYNNITGNHVSATGQITSWCYTIQVMGAYNNVINNTVTGGFRGISTQSYENNTIIGNDVHAIYQGIYACAGAVVSNNNVHVNGTAHGIAIGSDNVRVINNTIITDDGQAIDIYGNNAFIANNTITSTNSYGIFSRGSNTRIIIDNNKITSTKEGILFKQQSRTKMMNHVYVNGNTIVSRAEYAINFEEVGSQVASEVNVTVTSSNVLTSSRGNGLVAYLKPSNSNSSVELDTDQVVIVTPGNYTKWFINGIANDTIQQNATVYLEGTFNNLSFTFNKKVHVIGRNCLINNGSITLASDAHSSTINNITINNKENITTVHAIELLEVNNCKITDVNIANFADKESLGIFLYDSHGNTLSNLTITTSGDFVNNAIFLYASDSNNISNNKINLNQSNIPQEYADSIMFSDKIGTIQEVLHNHGIILLYSSNNIIDKNKVNATSNFKNYTFPTIGCRNSMVGIDIYFDSHNNKVTNNNVSVVGYGPYNYGIGVLGGQWGTAIETSNSKNNQYESNNVYVEGGYFATGFIAGRNSVNTTLSNNNLTVKILKNNTNAGDYAHGITLENSTNSNIIENTLTSTGSSVYSIELFHSGNNNIFKNTIKANATYPYGIAGTTSSNNNIQNNTITLNKVNLGESIDAIHGESIESGEEAIMLMDQSTQNNIKYNTIKTNTNSTIKLTSETSYNNVTENSLIANKTTGDNSVENEHSTNTVKNNFIYFVNITVDSLTTQIGDTINLTAHVTTTTNDVKNLSVSFKIGTTEVGTSKVSNGKAVYAYTIPTYFNPTTYQITAFASGTNFQNATGIGRANIGKDPEPISVKVEKVLTTVDSTVFLTANVTVISTGGKIGAGQAEFYVDNTLIDTVDVKLGVASVNYHVGSTSGVHTIKVKYLGTVDYKTGEGNNTLGVQTKTEITVGSVIARLGQNVNIAAEVTSGPNAVKTGIAHIYIGTHNIANATINNGIVNYKYTIPNTYTKNTYNLKVEYDGNDTLSSATGSSKIIIKAYAPVFSYNTTTVFVGEKVSLRLGISNGASDANYYPANDGNVSIKLNGQTITDSSGKTITGTVKNGVITFNFTAPAQLVGSQNITFSYDGNSKFDSLTKTYTDGLIITDNVAVTKITINPITTVRYANNFTITGKLTDITNKAIKNAQIQLTINMETINITTDSTGTFTYTNRTPTAGTNNVTAAYAGNKDYNPTSTTTTFMVNKQDLKIIIDPIKTVIYGHDVSITGKFIDGDGNLRANVALKIYINGKSVSTRTDASGRFNITSKVGVIGTNNVTSNHTGDKNFNPTNTSTTFTMKKQDLIITVDKISDVIYGSRVNITGTLKDGDGTLRVNTGVKILINGKSATAKTDKNGKYTFTTKIGKLGINNVTVSHAGGANYNPTSASTTYKVVKQDLKITLDKIGTVTYGSVTIKGRFTDSNNNPRANTGLKVSIKGKTATAKTDKDGYFTLTTKVGVVGVNNVTAYHQGGGNYNPTSTTITFKMVKQDLKIVVDKISTVTYGNSVVVTGTFTDASGKVRANSALKIIINGKALTTRTDSNGRFKATSKVGVVGVNNVTVSHNGGTGFNPTSTSTTFTMIKQDLKITINPITSVKKGSTVTVTGTFTDANNKIRANTNLKVNLNGVEYTTKSDANGVFTFKTTAKKVGSNTIIIAHTGGANYNPTNSTMSFTVLAS